MNVEQSFAALLFVVECEPDLAWNGYRAGFKSIGEFKKARAEWFTNNSTDQISPYEAEEFRYAISFLDLVPVARRKKIKACNSYALKHSAEVWSRQPHNPDRVENGGCGYVSNGALIAAAIYRDFAVEPIPSTFNAMIGKARGRTFDWPLVQTADFIKPTAPEPAIYFIGDGSGVVKIGYSRNVDKRMKVLATGSPRPLQVLLTIPGTRSDEGAFHEMFKAEHMHGEWFRLPGRIERFIASGGGEQEDARNSGHRG
ncbi:MAG TPA: GIY-YIG nuclease family protein [Xanthobacteraceae bacterium]|jgi:hypothetical protein